MSDPEHAPLMATLTVDLLKGAMAAQDERERLAGEKCGVPYELSTCDWPDAVADEVLGLRQELARLQRAIRRLDEGLSGPPGRRLSLETIAKRLEQLAERK